MGESERGADRRTELCVGCSCVPLFRITQLVGVAPRIDEGHLLVVAFSSPGPMSRCKFQARE